MNINELNDRLDKLIAENQFIIDIPNSELTSEMYDSNEAALMVNFDFITRVYLVNSSKIDKGDIEIGRFILPLDGKKLRKEVQSLRPEFEKLKSAPSSDLLQQLRGSMSQKLPMKPDEIFKNAAQKYPGVENS